MIVLYNYIIKYEYKNILPIFVHCTSIYSFIYEKKKIHHLQQLGINITIVGILL